MGKKEWKAIKCSKKTFESLDFLAKILNMKKSAFIEELFEKLINIFNEYPKSANIMYTVSRNQLIINSYGKSNIISGVAPTDQNSTPEQEDAIIKGTVEPVFNKEKSEIDEKLEETFGSDEK